MMSLCLPDGYCLDTLGPFEGTKNDASIASHIAQTNDKLTTWCSEGDTMIVDRGFRDAVDIFTDLGWEAKMPAYLKKGQKQHTTQEANEARSVTKTRWPVESYHARMKKWRFFSDRIENQMLPHLQDCVRIISAALNCYRGAIVKAHNTPEMDKLAELMSQRMNEKNALEEAVRQRKYSTRQKWDKIDEIDLDFPEMELDDLRELFFGSYQIKLCASYAEEHMNEDGDFLIQVSKETDKVIRQQIQSRHSNSVRYTVWIQFSLTGDPITSWYCTSKAGARTVGACAHVATIVWYLSYARHNNLEASKGRKRIQQCVERLEAPRNEEEDGDEIEV